MEQQLVFVLGALSGLVAIMLVYAFVGVFRMTRKITEIDSRLDTLYRQTHENYNDVNRRISKELRNVYEQISRVEETLFQRIETVERETDQRINDDKEELHRLLNRVHENVSDAMRYTDSRIDTATENIKKSLSPIPKEAKESTLINS